MAVKQKSTNIEALTALLLKGTFLISFLFYLVGCSSPSQPASMPNPETITPTSTASQTNTPPSTREPSSNATMTPSSTPDPLEPPQIASLGKGELGKVQRSPDGKVIIRQDSGSIYLYDASNGQEIGKVEKERGGYVDLIFSPDGKLATYSEHFYMPVIELATANILTYVTDDQGGPPALRSLAFSPDNQYAVFQDETDLTRSPEYHLGLWNIPQNKLEFLYPIKSDFLAGSDTEITHIGSPAISPDGKRVAAGDEKKVYVWDLLSGKVQLELKGHGSNVTGAAFSPNGTQLASCGADGTVRLWNAATGQMLQTITGFSNDLTGVRFSKDGRYLFVDVLDYPSQTFDLQARKFVELQTPAATPDPFVEKLHAQGFSDTPNSVLFSPDGSLLAVGSQSISLWDPDTQQILRVLENTNGSILSWAFSPDSRWLAATTESGLILVWNTQDGSLISTFHNNLSSEMKTVIKPGKPESQGLSFSPGSDQLAFGSSNSVEFWSIPGGKLLHTLPLSDQQLAGQIHYSTDGQRLMISILPDEIIQVWDTQAWELLQTIDLPRSGENSHHVSGSHWPWLARANSEKKNRWIELWNLETGKMTRLTSEDDWSDKICFSQDGRLLITATSYYINYWQTQTGQLIYHQELSGDSILGVLIDGVAMSPKGDILATGIPQSVELWDIQAIARAAQQPLTRSFVLPTPAPTSTESYHATSTPLPTVQITPQPLPALDSQALSPENAYQIAPLSSSGDGVIRQIAWVPDGKSYLVAASQGAYLQGNSAGHLQPQGQTYGAAQLPDGSLMAVAVNQGRVQVWSAGSRAPLFDQPGREPAISPDGHWLIYGVSDDTLQLVDLHSGKVTAELNSSWVTGLWDTTFTGSANFRRPIFSPDSRLVAVIREDLSMRVWDVETGKIVNGPGVAVKPITQYAFSPDSAYITAASGGSAWVWNLHTQAPPQRFEIFLDNARFSMPESLPPFPEITATGLDPRNHILAAGTSQGEIILIDLSSQKRLSCIRGVIKVPDQLVFSPDGSQLLSSDTSGMVNIWDVSTGKNISRAENFNGKPRGLSFLSNGDLSTWTDNAAQTLSIPELEIRQSILIPDGTIFAANPNGKQIAVYDSFFTQLWDTTNLLNRLTIEGETQWADILGFKKEDYAAFFSPDGRWLAITGTGGARIEDTQTGKQIHLLHPPEMNWVSFSQDSRRILTCSNTGYTCDLVVYDVSSGDALQQFEKNEYGKIKQFFFSPNGLQAAGIFNEFTDYLSTQVSSYLILWDSVSGAEIKNLAFPDQELASMAYSPDGRLIATGMANGQIALVDVEKFQVINTFQAHTGKVLFLAFSPDGRYLASSGDEGVLHTWGLP